MGQPAMFQDNNISHSQLEEKFIGYVRPLTLSSAVHKYVIIIDLPF